MRLDSTVVAGNTATSYPDLYGSYNSKSSNNLIVIGTGLTGILSTVRGNLVETSGSPLDPELDDPAWNGGPTRPLEPRTK